MYVESSLYIDDLERVFIKIGGLYIIEFNVISNKINIKQIPKKYPKLIEYEVYFSIIINGKLFFEEPNFPIYEFLYLEKKWENKNNVSFEYTSIETEENPLISYKYINGMYAIYSPWQLFECKTKFTKDQLVNALDDIKKKLNI